MIIAMGLPGAGKTTVLKNLKTDYTIHNFGDMMFEIEKEKFGIKDRDEMRKIPIATQKEVQKLVYLKLSKMGKKIILDTHCSVSTPKGFFPGVPYQFLQLLDVDALILITADIEDVIKRRADDKTRKRDDDDIALHDQINKAFLASYSAFSGAPAIVIVNKQGKLEESVAKFESILKG